MSDLALAILWHHHQPYYPDDQAGENPMPWVRLHGVKDYFGMALHLQEYPEMRCTINLVPSLLAQIRAYTERGAVDRPLAVSRLPAEHLSEEDALYLLDHFFMANPERMIRPYPRYAELYDRRAPGKNTAREALRRFRPQDFRDLQVWFNLAWVHPLAFEQDPDLRALLAQGRHFSEDDKHRLLAKHLEILGRLIPLHRKLAESGQVELTTTPFYHPILPLLFDRKLAREALPEVRLPHYTGGYPEDAAVHVARAVSYHAEVFGSPPVGMWPAEGSVCQEMIPLLAEHGIRWIATDEGILNRSTKGFVGRDEHGHVRNPGHLYRPYRVQEAGKELAIVFRDHGLSDRIGFQYQRSPGEDAVEDLFRDLQAIRRAAPAEDPLLVAIILDGENCWEHYPEGGVPFLRALYRRCTTTPGVRPVRIGEYLAEQPPRDTLPRLFPGSWIHHDFAIWIGHEEDNAGWNALDATRKHLVQRSRLGHIPPDRIRQAWEELYIAEGSDWFWWYGDDHHSAQDELFDYLFRKHLQNVYLLLGDTPPPELSRPICRKGQRPIHSLPHSFLEVKIDGRETFFEWLGAGRYRSRNERGTMAMVAHGPLDQLLFGFDTEHLLVRIDCDKIARQALADYDVLRLGFVAPPEMEVRVVHPAGERPITAWMVHGRPATQGHASIQVAIERIVEIAVPLHLLDLKAGDEVEFFVELLQNKQSRDRAPREGTIRLQCPGPDFEKVMWYV